MEAGVESVNAPIRVGVIGLGFMGATHVGAYQSASHEGFPCVLSAVCDCKPARRTGLLGDVGGNLSTGENREAFDPAKVRGYDAPEKLLADSEIDLVSICTPTDTHVELAIAALRAGKHVLVEKPVALRADEVKRVRDVARETGRVCMPAMCMRFWPGWSWLKERITDGTLGRCTGLMLERLGSAPTWSKGFYDNESRSGGALMDLHIHDTDFVRFCFGNPVAVTSTGNSGHMITHYHFDDGIAPVCAQGGWLAAGFPFRMRYVATFEAATADFDIGRNHPLLLSRDGGAAPVALDALSGYDLEIRHIVQTIVSRSQSPLATLDDAVEVAMILDAERRSLEAGTTITIT